MRTHLSVEDLDSFIDGNVTKREEKKIKVHLDECKKCQEKYKMILDIADHLQKEEVVEDGFTERVVDLLNQNKFTKKRVRPHIIRNNNILKPVLSGVVIFAFVGLAFYFGTKYDTLQRNPTSQSENLQISQITESPTGTATVAPPKSESVNLTLYFPNRNADCVVPVERQVEIMQGEKIEEVIFKELQRGPDEITEDSVIQENPVIPEGTRLLSSEIKDGICYLDLSTEFVDNNPGGTAFESVLINSIVNSLTELPKIEKVQFMIEGEKREVYSHMVFDEPFERNESFIRASDKTPEAIKNKIRELGNKVLSEFKNKDMEALALIIHPDKGVRFSPYTYVDVENDIVFTAEKIQTLLDNKNVFTWGLYDGIGEPIELTFDEYLSEFVYNQDFLNADEVFYDRHFDRGNTINNVFDVYPDSHVLEYYFKGFDPEFEGIDWESLKLIFEEKDGNWYLTGVVHDQWTI